MSKKSMLKDEDLNLFLYLAFGVCSIALVVGSIVYFYQETDHSIWDSIPWHLPLIWFGLALQVIFLHKRRWSGEYSD